MCSAKTHELEAEKDAHDATRSSLAEAQLALADTQKKEQQERRNRTHMQGLLGGAEKEHEQTKKELRIARQQLNGSSSSSSYLATLRKLRQRISELESQQDAPQGEHAQTAQDLEAQLKSSKAKLEEETRTAASAKNEVRTVNDSLKSAQECNESLLKEIQRLEAELEKGATAAEDQRKKSSKVSEELQETKATLDSTIMAHSKINEAAAEVTSSLRAEVQSLESKVRVQDRRDEKAREEIKKLRGRLDSGFEAREVLKGQLRQAGEEAASFKSQAVSAYGTLQVEKSSVDDRLFAANSLNKRLLQTIDQLKQANEVLETKLRIKAGMSSVGVQTDNMSQGTTGLSENDSAQPALPSGPDPPPPSSPGPSEFAPKPANEDDAIMADPDLPSQNFGGVGECTTAPVPAAYRFLWAASARSPAERWT